MISFRKVTLPLEDLDSLADGAAAEGQRFINRLRNEWETGLNRFDRPGEALFAAFDGSELVGIGALSIDPFLSDPDTGRIRRIFVRDAWRRRGIGAGLVAVLLAEARPRYRQLRLRTINAEAARVYERLGFVPVDAPNATHILNLETPPAT